ncbi:MAG: hypothetical protein FJ034_08935, partial [Chloroflexi bacterium]|nr:hypothetical protein [Chloroflexota bacterium]
MLDRVLRAVLVAAAVLCTAGAHSASADDGPPSDAAGRHPQTVLRGTPARQLVIFVGGLGSQPNDGAFDRIADAFRDSPRFEVIRFGADPAFPYDASGPIDGSARALVAQVRNRAPAYAGVHLVTHSMGGVVADRALAHGLSQRDGLRSYVAIAAPHDGSAVARAAVGTLDAAGDEASVVREALAMVADIGAPAVRDLAAPRITPPAQGIARLDIRSATDQLVLRSDARSSSERTLLPPGIGLDDLNGHGGVLRDARTIELVRRTVTTGLVPADSRGPHERAFAGLVSAVNDRAVAAALLVAAAALLSLVRIRRLRRLVPRLLPLGSGGQALVEFALVLPLLLAMAWGLVFLAEVGVARLSLEHAAAEAARTGALTNSDALMRESAAAASAPLEAGRLSVEIDPPEGADARAGDPRGALLTVRLAYPMAAPAPLGALTVRGRAARRVEWT